MLTGGECYKTQSHIFPKSSTRYSPLLFNSLKRGKTFFAFQGRSLNNEALLNKQTEESPVKLFIKQPQCTKRSMAANSPAPPRTDICLRPQIKHITTSQQKYVFQWDLSRVQLNKSLEISGAKPQGRAYFYCETFSLEITFTKGHLETSMAREGEERQEARQTDTHQADTHQAKPGTTILGASSPALNESPMSKQTAFMTLFFKYALEVKSCSLGNSGSGRGKDQVSTSKSELFYRTHVFSSRKA